MRELSAIYLTGWARIEPSQLLQKTMFDRKTNGKTCALPVFLYSPMSRELALLMICPVASLMKSTAMFSTSVPLKTLYIPPYM